MTPIRLQTSGLPIPRHHAEGKIDTFCHHAEGKIDTFLHVADDPEAEDPDGDYARNWRLRNGWAQ